MDKALPEIVEWLAEAMIWAEPGEESLLVEVRNKLTEIAQRAASTEQPRAAAGAHASAEIMARLVDGEIQDVEAALKLVSRSVEVLQLLICDSRDPLEVAFPDELGLDKKEEPEPVESAELPPPTDTAVRPPPSLYPHVDEQLFSDFLARRKETAAEIEEMVLEIEASGSDSALKRLKGLLHTVKGEAAMMGLPEMERVCHVTEDLLSREEPRRVVNRLLAVKDWVGQTIGCYCGEAEDPVPVAEVVERLTAPVTDTEEEEDLEPEEELPPENPFAHLVDIDAKLMESFVAEVMEHLDSAENGLLTLESTPHDDEALNSVFRAYHTIKGAAGFLNLDEIRSLAHELENLLDAARKDTLAIDDIAAEVAFNATDHLRQLVGALGTFLGTQELPEPDPSVPELLERIRAAVAGEMDGLEEDVSPDEPTATEKEMAQQPAGSAPVPRPPQGTIHLRDTVKVDAERLDRLLDTVGELVITEAMVSQSETLRASATTELERQLRQLDKITRSLQEMSTSLRMVPVRPVFRKMARLVRDLARKSRRPVDFVMTGEDTELDKAVVDRIGDPLVHLLRNAVDHGIEPSPEERVKAGKAETGRVELRAFQRGGSIFVEVQDDGRGLDRVAILAKATERGLVSGDEPLTDSEILGLIFEPGFSTAKNVTDVSGRGVGMDVVKQNVDAMRGQVQVKSTLGNGCLVSIRLPLTLAIIDGMVVQVGGERYIVPTLSIVRSVRPSSRELSTIVGKGEMLMVEGMLTPLFRLANLFDVESETKDATDGLALIVEDSGRRVALLVDELLGQYQIVIKGIGDGLGSTPGVSGGAIMADGRVGLVLDIAGLVRLAHGVALK